MQETLHGIHAHDNTKGDVEEEEHADYDYYCVGGLDSSSDCFLEEDFGELTMS